MLIVSKRICSMLVTLKNSNRKIIWLTIDKTRHVKTTFYSSVDQGLELII